MKSTGERSSNELQWLDIEIGHQDNSPNNGRRMTFRIRYEISPSEMDGHLKLKTNHAQNHWDILRRHRSNTASTWETLILNIPTFTKFEKINGNKMLIQFLKIFFRLDIITIMIYFPHHHNLSPIRVSRNNVILSLLNKPRETIW